MNRLMDLYRGVRWLGLLSLAILPLVFLTQPASYNDGFTLSVVLVSVFFVVLALVSSVGLAIRNRARLRTGSAYVLQTSLRQGFITAATVVLLLVLQLLRVVGVLDAILVAVLAIVMELYLGTRKAAA